MKAETLSIPGFDGSMLMSYSYADNGKNVTLHELQLVNNNVIPPVTPIYAAALNKDFREKLLSEGHTNRTYSVTFTGIRYIINSSSLGRDELLRIAENIR